MLHNIAEHIRGWAQSYAPSRSAWDRGVLLYIDELCDNLAETIEYNGRNPADAAELKEWLLNGARDWSQYSWGGCSLVYDCDIAERLCTPSELKKRRGGEWRPSRYEDWLDVQARALRRAAYRVTQGYRTAMAEMEASTHVHRA